MVVSPPRSPRLARATLPYLETKRFSDKSSLRGTRRGELGNARSISRGEKRSFFLVRSLLAAVLMGMPLVAHAASAEVAESKLDQVKVGVGGVFKVGRWTLLTAQLGSRPVSARLEVDAPIPKARWSRTAARLLSQRRTDTPRFPSYSKWAALRGRSTHGWWPIGKCSSTGSWISAIPTPICRHHGTNPSFSSATCTPPPPEVPGLSAWPR